MIFRIVICILTVITLFISSLARAQCQHPPSSSKLQPSKPPSSPPGTPDFYDEPQFTVAGVSQTTNAGGHGSDVVQRNTEALAKATVSLSKEPPASSSPALSAADEKLLRGAADRQPADFEANRRFGSLLVKNGDAKEAIPYLERASRLNPHDYQNSYDLALAYAGAGEWERARSNARNVLARQDTAELHHLLGDLEEKLGNPLQAVQEYQRAAELDASEPNLFDWGADLLAHRATEPAIVVFTKGNRLFPSSVRILVGLSVALYARGSYDQAAQRLWQASDLDPNDPHPYLFLGRMQGVEVAQADATVERLGRFVRLQPENAQANYYYALALWKQHKDESTESLAQVESLLHKAVQLDPKLSAAYLQLGVLYSDRGDFPKAISAYQKAVEISPRMEEAHYRLAQAYRRTGEDSKAQQELQLYQQISKERAQEAAQQRREIQQFVYTLQGRTPPAQPQ